MHRDINTTRNKRLGSRLAAMALAGFGSSAAQAVGTWTALTNHAPGNTGHMLLLSDGTVMVQNNGGKSWYRLTPDATGSYANGSWSSSTIADMHDTREYYASQVLMSGKVFVAGGEYGTGGSNGEVYDPVSNVWTQAPSAGGVGFVDAVSEILSDGRVLVAPVSWLPYAQFITMIYNPGPNTWTVGPASSAYQNECSWVKLPDDSILTIDINATSTERYFPSTNTWAADAPVTLDGVHALSLWGGASEIGPGLLLPNGKVLFLGGNGHTAIYTPSGSTATGSWIASDDIPSSRVSRDAPSCMMSNGKILCTVSSSSSDQPAYFYEYDYAAATGSHWASVNSPTGGTSDNNNITDAMSMLQLPDGNVLFNDTTNQLYVYKPSGSPLVAGKPVISSIHVNADGTYHLIGSNLNGISEGAAYGDDAQMNTNYPLVRLTSGSTVYYARSYNWSSTGVQKGGQTVTTEFALPSLVDLSGGYSYSLSVVTNGIASDAVSFYGPVWADYNYNGSTQLGSYIYPYHFVGSAVSIVSPGEAVFIKGGSVSPETMKITKAMTLAAAGGHAFIGVR